MEDSEKEDQIIEQLKKVYDPEIPVNVYDLGLIYDFEFQPNNKIQVLMTLTSPSCAMAGMILDEVKERVNELSFIEEADVELTWDPPWEKSMMSEEAKFSLGFM